MTSLTNSVITTVLGWMRSVAGWCWHALTTGTGDGLPAWIGRHWLLLAVILCLIGVAIDLAVYILRWRPQEVWRSFFQRLFDRRHAETDVTQRDDEAVAAMEEPPEEPEEK